MSDIKLTLGNEAPAAATQTAEEIMPEKKVPEPAQPVFTPEEQKTIDEFSKKIDVTDTNLVFQYGAGAQQKIAQFSDSALASVQTKDLGEVGDMMANLVAELKGFNADPDEKKGLFGFIRKNVDKMTLLKARYDEAEVNVNKIVSSLESHQVTLLKDIATLDQLYEMNLDYFKELSMYIAAGKKRLEEVRATDLAEATKRAEASGLAEDAQAAKDLADKCDRFEKKLYDLELTRNIAIQMGPQIRLIQNNDQVMAEKIQSTMVNTIPLWKSQMVIALGLHHAQEAMKAQRSVSDLTNDLLRSNAERLHTASVEVAKESERGIIDIETLTATNQRLIDTMDEVLAIQQDGREKRRAAEGELARIEGELRSKLLEINNKK
ncbi:MAG: toxic anion resistance protein [Eubacteriales bacterium]|nr:toxic anion resistance protein [Eubacteriales bacterium]